MTGIQYITDDKGNRTAAVINLKEHEELWEDIMDMLVCAEREHEIGIPLEEARAQLVAAGKLSA